ncbi:MAG: TetR/AcrR family transcriptional regulator [Spirochaetaceae bacterium]
MGKYHNDIFDRIPQDKKKLIYKVATSEFSAAGYSGANINTIADKIGISVGSLYKYFSTKENLFLSTVELGRESLKQAFNYLSTLEGGLFFKIDEVIQIIQEHSKEHPDMIILYNELTTVGYADLTKKLSNQMETISADYYSGLIEDAQNSGEILNKSDAKSLALFIDNLLLNLQFSYSNEYYKERMSIYLGEKTVNDKQIREDLLTFIKNALIEGDNG